jgi:beta-glucosidase-like glycosyl hydrolase
MSVPLAERVDDLIAHLRPEEKFALLIARATSPIDRLGIPGYNWGANCVHGVQSTCGTHCPTSFPNPVNFGAMFDPSATHEMARIIGMELRALWAEGVTENYDHAPPIGLDCWSPNINLNRDPR